jgi:hypothetical protein
MGSKSKCLDGGGQHPNDNLPIAALSLIFPYRSYIGTLANGVWIGNPPGKLAGRIIDLGQESRPETCGFRLGPKASGAEPDVAVTEAAGGKKSALGPSPFSYPTSLAESTSSDNASNLGLTPGSKRDHATRSE